MSKAWVITIEGERQHWR